MHGSRKLVSYCPGSSYSVAHVNFCRDEGTGECGSQRGTRWSVSSTEE